MLLGFKNRTWKSKIFLISKSVEIVFKDSVSPSQTAHCMFATKTVWLMLSRRVALRSRNCMERMNKLCGQTAGGRYSNHRAEAD